MDTDDTSSDGDSLRDECDYRNDAPIINKSERASCNCASAFVDSTVERVSVEWPPQPGTSNNWRHLRHVQWGNPLYGTKMQLYCKTGYFLGIYHSGEVRGTDDENDLHTCLELVSVGHPGHLRIRGMATDAFVAMDKKGRLYMEIDPTEESTIFIESFQGSYNTYLSRKFAHLGWYIGIKRNGKAKRGPRTAYGQNAISFLPRRTRFEQ